MEHPTERQKHVLVVDDHGSARQSVAEIMEALDYRVTSRGSAVEALDFLSQQCVDLVFTDLMMPGMDGLEFIQALNRRRIASQVVMFTAHASVDTAVRAMKIGAFDYIEKPFTLEQLESVAARAMKQQEAAESTSCAGDPTMELLGGSRVMQDLKQKIRQVAATDETVLVTGESGTGKELVARAIHQASRRSQQPWVAVNCPALSPQLMESEWFGHEKGAFTHAEGERIGRFEAAQRGTILLDEVTEIEISLQAKLLRVLQERCYERVGSSQTRPLDVRVVATTNRDMPEEIQQGRFRQDLYYRLNVIPVPLQPLRARRDDILPLASHFLERSARRLEVEPIQLDDSCQNLLYDYSWPGNVREIQNLMTRITVLAQDGQVAADALRSWLSEPSDSQQAEVMTAGFGKLNAREDSASAVPTLAFAARIKPGVSLQSMERQLIEATLEQFNGHREKTAQALGIGVRTLSNKLRSYGYQPREKSFQRAG